MAGPVEVLILREFRMGASRIAPFDLYFRHRYSSSGGCSVKITGSILKHIEWKL
jgi:hypothetical protein